MYPLSGALPVSYVAVRVTRGAVVAPRSTARRTYIPISVSLWNDLADLYLLAWDWRALTAEPIRVYWHQLLVPLLSSTVFPSLFLFLWVGIVELGTSDR